MRINFSPSSRWAEWGHCFILMANALCWSRAICQSFPLFHASCHTQPSFDEPKKKARVYVKDGVVLIGELDETRLVPENCVFLQVGMAGDTSSRSQDGNRFEVITGDVMATKHPVMH